MFFSELPMNKIQVGSAPSPNLKVVRSKIGSLQNTSHKPGGGQVKIENRKLEWKAGTRIMAKNDTYVPGGGDKKVSGFGYFVVGKLKHINRKDMKCSNIHYLNYHFLLSRI